MNCRSSRKSLDYTKQSLRISIDLGKREEESETWLQVGRIYYLIQEDELADMYLQVWKRVETSSLSLCASEHSRHTSFLILVILIEVLFELTGSSEDSPEDE